MHRDAQVRLYRKKRMDEKTQEAAAAGAGMSVRSGRRWETGGLPSQERAERDWRTRADPFAGVWSSEVEPLLKADEKGVLEAKTLIEVLKERHPEEYGEAQLRTLQRRVREWRALYGPSKEVMFEQTHGPGKLGAVDFTNCNGLEVTICRRQFDHLLFELVLAYSRWTYVDLAFGETFEALVEGVQGAVWEAEGCPGTLRSDNLSAATHELARTGGRALNRRFADVLDHYGMKSTRIEPGESHQNGVVEKAHDLLKSMLAQELVLRGSRDFESQEGYLGWVRQRVAKKRNAAAELLMVEERKHLLPLPAHRVPNYTKHEPRVRKWSTISVGRRVYSVPSRLIGQEVEVRQYPNVVEVRYADKVVETMPRLRGEKDHRIDYRHVIWSLVRKPGAFAAYRFREELFPTLTFRRAYDALRERRGDRADVEYVRVLHLAASTMEVTVERALQTLLERKEPFDYLAVKAIAHPEQPSIPEVKIGEPDFAGYDSLLAEPSLLVAGGER